MADQGLSSEILKLMDKIAKNPASRLFVPLAEEYLKSDMLDEAILVLADGIKSHPTYVAARVMLGKIYLQRKQTAEAKAEFEQVIAVNPENILAHKKLAAIYQGEGNLEKAVDACRKILVIDPSDKESKLLASLLEKEIASVPKSEPAFETLSIPDPVSPVEAPQIPAGEPTPAPSDDPGATNEAAAAIPFPEEVMPLEPLTPESFPPPQSGGDASLSIPPSPIPEAGPEPLSHRLEEILQDGNGLSDSIDLRESNGFSSEEAATGEPVDAGETGEEAELNEKLEELDFGAPIPMPASFSPTMEPPVELEVATATLASLYMGQGHYQEAAEVYKKLLTRNPSDEESRKGLEEALRRLAEPSGPAGVPSEAKRPQGEPASPSKDKARRLQAWLDSIRKDQGE